MILDTVGIQKILPHRYPFLMVDAILEMERFKRIVGVKNVSINESLFSRPFSGQAGHAGGPDHRSHGSDRQRCSCCRKSPSGRTSCCIWLAVDDARLRRPVIPGEQLLMEMIVLGWRGRGTFCKLQGKATVNGELAAEATLMCKMVDSEPAVAPSDAATDSTVGAP